MSPDVLILGAGPAGLAAALALRQHAPHLAVAVLAGGVPREKIGETLPPGAQSMLRALGVWDAFLATSPLPAYGTCSAWGTPQLEANEFIFHPDRRGWHIERRSFDALLAWEAEKRGVTIVREAGLHEARFNGMSWSGVLRASFARGESAVAAVYDRRSTAEADSSAVIDRRHSAELSQPITARFIIDATGRAATFAEQAGATRVPDDRLVAISMTFQIPPERPMRDTYALVEACAAGWWYSSLQPDGRLVVACFTDADLAREQRLKSSADWLAAATCAPHTLGRIQDAVPEGAPTLRAADSTILDRLVGPGWLATGDAATTFDPLSSQGVVKALREGSIAAYAITDHFMGDAVALPKYDALLRREYRDFLTAKSEFYGREQRWPRARFWSRRYSGAASEVGSLLAGDSGREPAATVPNRRQAGSYLQSA